MKQNPHLTNEVLLIMNLIVGKKSAFCNNLKKESFEKRSFKSVRGIQKKYTSSVGLEPTTSRLEV